MEQIKKQIEELASLIESKVYNGEIRRDANFKLEELTELLEEWFEEEESWDETFLAMGDLDGMSQDDLKGVAVDTWNATSKELESATILIAYMCEENYEGHGFFLFKDKDGTLFEVHGSHCSCYGFEGQWDPEETTAEAMLFRKSIGCYGSDDKTIRKFIETHLQ